MRVSCVLSADEIMAPVPDLVVLPEGTVRNDLECAASIHSETIIVGAYRDGRYMRAALFHRGRNQIEYLKILCDGRTPGSGKVDQRPIYLHNDTCIGVLVCRDLDHGGFVHRLRSEIRHAEQPIKVICVPADMGAYWFPSGSIALNFSGVHVLLSNHTTTHGDARRKNFISNPFGEETIMQSGLEPIYATLPFEAH